MREGPARVLRASSRTVRSIAVEVVIVCSGVVAYFGIRGLTGEDHAAAMDHARDIVHVEQVLGLDLEKAMQLWVLDSDPVTTVANWIYIWGHWPVIVATLLFLALRHRVVYLRLRNAMMISGGLGLCVYTTYPVAPPRLAGLGLVDTVTERSSAYRILQPPAFVNQYAAMPSLHVGWDLLVGLALIAAAGALWLRTVGRVMPVLMALATVLTANHYLLDVLGGIAFALVGYAGALAIERRREGVTALDAAPAAPPEESGRPAAPPVVPDQRQPEAIESPSSPRGR